jgi:hypothetical protein
MTSESQRVNLTVPILDEANPYRNQLTRNSERRA